MDPGPQQAQEGGQDAAMQTAADRSAQRTEHRAHRATTYRAPESRARAAAQSVVRSPAVKKSNARALKIIGLIVMAVGLLSAASPADMVFSGYVANWIGDLLKYLAIAVGGLGMFCGGLRMDANMRRYARYLAVLGETQAVPVSELSRKLGATMIQSFNDEDIMAGQGTAGLEIVEQCPEVDKVIVPVSGGGLIGGVSTAIKGMVPRVKVYGAEPAALPRYSESLKAGKPVKVEQKRSLADALVAQIPGDICFPYVQANTDGFAAVEDQYMLKGMKLLLTEGKVLCEPSSGIGMGAVMQGLIPVSPQEKVCFLISGGSVGLDQLRILEEVEL